MRNLKKFLALVLAMVMAFSLMVTANAQVVEWEDGNQADEAFTEAIDVLSGMKVFQGDEKGFRPAANITRAEVAVLLYRIATGDVDDARTNLYVNSNAANFTDVHDDDWFAGYVGYCANAGYIKGHNGAFNPYAPVTGYEVLAMILRAVGYDVNGEFTGGNWQTTVSSTATQLGILNNVKTTHYGNTLHLASRRDVVADLLFQTAAYVPMVKYSVAFGYQDTGMTGGVIGTTKNPSLGKHVFGLTLHENGVLLGNEQTGEGKDKSVMGYASNHKLTEDLKKMPTKDSTGATIATPISWSAYTWEDDYDYSDVDLYGDGTNDTWMTGTTSPTAATAGTIHLGNNITYELSTGIDLIGHKLKLWFDDGSGVVSNNKKHVFAYYDKAKTDVVYADNTSLVANSGDNVTELAEAIAGTELKNSGKAVFNNSFGKFGTNVAPTTTAGGGSNDGVVGDGIANDGRNGTTIGGGTTDNRDIIPAISRVGMYKIIDNTGDGYVDAVISLNVEVSQITESNAVNRVPTIGVPVIDDTTATAASKQTVAVVETPGVTEDAFVSGDNSAITVGGDVNDNLKGVGVTGQPATTTGVIAKDALVGNSTSALRDYEFGIHITGTSPRTVSDAEAAAINNQTKTDLETAYFLMAKVEPTVEGKIVGYNNVKGTITLENGTVLERSDFYHAVAGWNDRDAVSTTAPASKLPQGWVWNQNLNGGAGYWEEGYANDTYKFYLDYEGKYLGASRSVGVNFLYGTYMDYEQATSTSTFKYFLTGVDLNGEIKTIPVSKVWDTTPAAGDSALTINSTTALGVPFRDTYGSGVVGGVNGIGEGMYRGYAYTGETVDGNIVDSTANRNENVQNMARLGVKRAHNGTSNLLDASDASGLITLDRDSVFLGAEKVNSTGAGKYFTEATKFILVDGYGTDSVKATVYNGISDLMGSASIVNIDLGATTTTRLESGWTGGTGTTTAGWCEMTYFTESRYTYAQTGVNDMQVNTIIMPVDAVSWAGGSSLYYIGDPRPVIANSWGADAWKYNLYVDGVLQQVWLANDPSTMESDRFMTLISTGETANDGGKIYWGGEPNTVGGVISAGHKNPREFIDQLDNSYALLANGNNVPNNAFNTLVNVKYSATTRDAQTATFTEPSSSGETCLLRVSGAKVVNLNKDAGKIAYNPTGSGTLASTTSGEIWPNITDLATLNEAGSISPVTNRDLRVSIVVDEDNPLVVTTIYVCFDQFNADAD